MFLSRFTPNYGSHCLRRTPFISQRSSRRGNYCTEWKNQPREVDNADLVIVGGGPSGLASAIRFKQLCKQHGKELRVCLLEKGAEIGNHILSGAVLEPRALNELIPDWKERGAPLDTPVTKDSVYWLVNDKTAVPTPVISSQHNIGNYIISLGNLTRWLAQQAEELGVEIYPGFPAGEVLYHEDGSVKGVATVDQGISKKGKPTESFQRGMELHAPIVFFAEGCRGSCSKQVIKKFDLRKNCDPQTYGIGLKEEFQKWKHHPVVKKYLQNGKPISYGARALNEGGFQSIPELVFPGGALLGCSAGFLNVPKIKGIHTAMKSGIVAAEAAFNALKDRKEGEENKAITLKEYPEKLKNTWLWEELRSVRNIRPAFNKGMPFGVLFSGVHWLLTKGKEPWTWHFQHADHEVTKKASECKPIHYPKPDGILSFDLLTNLARSGTNHNEDQPPHLKILNDSIPVNVNLKDFAGLEQNYCPANVYEYVQSTDGSKKLQINAQNCLHCKTCDIKDPKQNINWTTPEGGGGPAYTGM